MPIRTIAGAALTAADAIPQSVVALAARLAAANVFWRSARTKVDGFSIKESTFWLFREEYKLPVLPPDAAAYMATAAEHVFPVLLVVGLASRLSAAALMVMVAVIQLFVFPGGWPEHSLWATALLVVIARGPGAFSLDHVLFRPAAPAPAPAFAR